MRTNRREFLQTSALASLAAAHSTSVASDGRTAGISTDAHLNASEIARRHMIVRDTPSPSFFDGMLLGNGDVGACVVVRPDALAIHIGKNDCWDIRVSEDIADHVLPFREVLQLWQRASEEAKKMEKPNMLYVETAVPFFREYSERVASSYDGKKWPRPWPCGTIWINWDPTWVEPSQHTLDLATGLFTLTLRCRNVKNENSRVQLFVFVDWETGLISASTDQALPVRSIVYSPEIDGFHAGPFESGKNYLRYNIGGGDDALCGTGNQHYACITPWYHATPGYEPSSGNYLWTQDANQRWVATHAQSLGANLFEAVSYS